MALIVGCIQGCSIDSNQPPGDNPLGSDPAEMNYDEAMISEDSLEINGESVYDNDFGICLEWLSSNFEIISTCPYCSTRLDHVLHRSKGGWCEWDEGTEERLELWVCGNCAFWQCLYQNPLDQNTYGCPDHFAHAGISKLKQFSDILPHGCYQELAQALRRNPMVWHSMHPKDLEQLVSAVFKQNYQNSEVFHVGKPHDGGVDVLFIDSDDRQWLIQVKRRENPHSSEGIGTIRNLLGTMVLKDSSCGIVVSTADHFTYRAYEGVGKASTLGMTVKLIDRGKLDRMLGPMLPQRPWSSFVESYYPEYLNVTMKQGRKSSKSNPKMHGVQLRLF